MQKHKLLYNVVTHIEANCHQPQIRPESEDAEEAETVQTEPRRNQRSDITAVEHSRASSPSPQQPW